MPRWVCGLAVLALAAGCAPAEAPHPGALELPSRVESAATTDASLTLSVTTAAEAGYRVRYIRLLDWEVVDGTLTNTDGTIPTLSRTAAATVDGQLSRQATLRFAPVKAAGGYTLSLQLKRRDRAGVYQTIASGTKAGFSLSPGANTATVTLTPTASGQLSVSVPQPAPSFTPPPVITTAQPMTGSVNMLVTFSGSGFGATTGQNVVSFNGAPATVSAAGATSVKAVVPAGATTGDLTLKTPTWPAVSAGTYTVVASGTTLGTYGVGAGPYGLAKDPAGNVWVANAGGTTVSKIRPDGTVEGPFAVGAAGPFALDVDNGGTLWIATYSNPSSVVRMASDGTVLGTTSTGNNVVDIEFDPAGNAWLSNYGDNTVTKLSATGAVIGTYSVGINPSQVSGMAIDASGNVWVGIYNRGRLVKLANDGSTSTGYNIGSGFSSAPASVELDASGNLWVTLEGDNRLCRVASDGSVTASYAAGSGPRGLAVDALGNLWVCNVDVNQVLKISPSGTVLGTYALPGRPNDIIFDASRAACVSLQGTNSVVRLAL